MFVKKQYLGTHHFERNAKKYIFFSVFFSVFIYLFVYFKLGCIVCNVHLIQKHYLYAFCFLCSIVHGLVKLVTDLYILL